MAAELLAIVEEKLKATFGDQLLHAELLYDFPVFIIAKPVIYDVVKYLKEDKELNFSFLTTMCGLHFPEQKEEEFGMMYQLHNLHKNWRIRLKTFMSREDLKLPTLTTLWDTANWMEREAYDFFGFIFEGHPDLRKILNMEEMNYFPLRKEYPLEDLGRGDKSDKMFGR